MTVFINGGFAQILFRYIWYTLLDENKYDITKYSFSDYVALAVYGDDNLLNPHPNFRSIFNGRSIGEVCARYGITYTDGSKNGPNTEEFKKIEDVHFLKRSFTWDDSLCMHVARLDLATILEIPQWTWSDTTDDDIVMGIEQSIRELAFHDDATYDQWARLILSEARAVGYSMIRVNSRSVLRRGLLDQTIRPVYQDVL